MMRLTRDTESFQDFSILAEDNQTVRLRGAANETLSFQLILDAPAGGMERVSLESSVLELTDGTSVQTIPASAIRFYRMLPVKVTNFPAWYMRLVDSTPHPDQYYDILVPSDASNGQSPYTLKSNQRLAVWVDIKIARLTRAGIYRGTIRLESKTHAISAIPLELHIQPFALPDERLLIATGGFDHRAIFRRFIQRQGRPYIPVYLDAELPEVKQGLQLVDELMQVAHEHRLDLFDRSIHPKVKPGIGGELQIDWKGYDAIVTPYLTGKAFPDKIGVKAWPIPLSDQWPNPDYYGQRTSQTYQRAVKQLIKKSGIHFRSLGAEEQVFAWPVRGEPTKKTATEYLQIAPAIRAADRGVPILAQLPPVVPRESRLRVPASLDKYIDILSPPADLMNPDEGAKRKTPQNPMHGMWLCPGRPPYLPGLSILATPADLRAIPWFAVKYDCNGLFFPDVLHWNIRDFQQADTAPRLFYPADIAGYKGILPSARLKRLRRGLQDIAYLWILRQRNRGRLARAITHSMVRYGGLDAVGTHYRDAHIGGWVSQGNIWQDAHEMLAIETAQAVHPKKATESELIADQIRWQKFADKTSQVRIEQIKTRIRPGRLRPSQIMNNPPDNAESLRAIIDVELFNEYGRDVRSVLQLQTPPAGWVGVQSKQVVARFPAGQRRQASIILEGLEIPPTPIGKIPVSLNLTSLNKRREFTAEIPFIVAESLRKPVTIDGHLRDWSSGLRNTAGQFRLLGRRGQGFGSKGMAKRQTLAFVKQDDKYLYLAIRCNEPNPAGMKVRATNKIHYDELLACGEDLLEILLDPGAKAQSPEDLYHIVVKPNGVVVQEMGINSNPPLGRVQTISLGVEVAVQKQANVWIVEMRIPRSAFGEDGKSTFWGINFLRFATQGAEASSWAAAERYFYDPRSLGTLFVFPPTKTNK